MAASLLGVQAKVDRAYAHLQELNTAMESFIDTQPWTVVGNTEGDWHINWFRIERQPDPTYGVLLGDIVHNLRSALDHLVWQLVIKNRKLPGKANQFPILDTPEEWGQIIRREKASNRAEQKPPRKWLKGVSKADMARIEGLQPYVRWPLSPEMDPLAQLAWLNNVDKHRVVHPAFGYLSEEVTEPQLLVSTPGGFVWDVQWAAPETRLEDGTEVVRFKTAVFPGVTKETQVNVHTKIPIGIVFGEWAAGRSNIFGKDRIEAIYYWVKTIVNWFEAESFKTTER